MFIIRILSLLLIKAILVRNESFTSTTHLTQLLKTEIALAKSLETHLKQEYERLDQIEKFVNVIKDEIRQAQGNEEYYFGNPVNSYLFIKHLTADWYNIEELLPTNFSKNLADKWIFPSFEDYTGSATGLLRLQDTYKLNTSQLANGEISTKFKSKRLSALECYDLGRVAYTSGDFYHTLMWMQEALDHLDKEQNKTSINKIDILDHLAYATSQQGNVEHALAVTEELLKISPNHIRANNNKIYYETIIKNRTLSKQQRKGDTNTNEALNPSLLSANSPNKNYKVKNERPDDLLEEHELYEELCRQNQTRLSPQREAKLFCRYRHNNHPLLILRPVKEEQKSPRSNHLLHRNAWLRNDDSPVVARLSRLIGAITNLNMITAEDLQIANYGVGGHYEPHFDFARKSEKDAFSSLGVGNRIATWLTYMTDVEQGGATVFPIVGGHLKPKKGSAAFWYNLYASGEGDYNTRHAACPVLIGNKWVANKWIHERGQEFRRPCSLDPMA
ncbi:unnamed protein product [Adineta ricciae]|uniref:procollagen-proline 4-dioxygenase n=1 Tax=Adineta ricciae TaxID=249248 RepID=A0A813W2V0_ADIRI|nr:unnamed protein product [Adineta ricciae]